MNNPVMIAIAIALMALLTWYVLVVSIAFARGINKEEIELDFFIAKFTVARATLILMYLAATPLLAFVIIFTLSAFSGEPMEKIASDFFEMVRADASGSK